jgi:ISXO2-like transposase domain
MQRTCPLSLSVPPHTPDVTMDHRVKPGGDAVGSVWSILRVEYRVAGPIGTFHKMSRKYMPLYVAEFQFRYNNRFNPDMFGTAISGC